MSDILPYQQEPLAVIERLHGDPTRGLASEVVQQRQAEYGPNELAQTAPTPWWQRFLAQFQDTLVIILLVATVISFVEWGLQSPRETALPYDGIVILAIVILNALLGFVQEERAEEAVQALMALAAPETTVVRAGVRQRVPARELVPGDIVLLESGDRVPADARVVEAINLRTDEAALTGESLPVEKDAAAIKAAVGLGDRINMLFAGTTVTFGRGRAVIVQTGMGTEVGHIAGLIQRAVQEPTPLQKELDRTGKFLSWGMLGICAVVFLTGVFVRGADDFRSILQLFLFAVALAVAAIPEALPAIVTAGLALGVRRMADSHAIVRKLPAVETLGAATVICTDKTGTLTRNEMTVRKIYTGEAIVDVSGSGYEPTGQFTVDGEPLAEQPPELIEEIERTLQVAALANDAELVQSDERWKIQGDPTEGALVVAAAKYGFTEQVLHQRFPRIGEVSFTSERKRHTTIHRDTAQPSRWIVCVKGAPDVVIGRCALIREGQQNVPLSAERRAELVRQNELLAGQALRTLAMAYRALPTTENDGVIPHQWQENELEHDLVFLGIIGMIDPPRAEAQAAVATCYRAGIRPIMITGDHPLTAVAIARELGILSAEGQAITGAQLNAMDDAALSRAVREVQVYARVDPEHKLRIVEALQRQGEIVAMTGDGINDAPALKTANIGIAMGITGTDVSKEAADMVLTDDNFASIVKAVEEGRGIFDNIRKYLYYLLSCNAGELLTMFLGVMLAGWFGLSNPHEGGFFLPLLAAQLLWINLITDGPPALALGIDPKDPDVMSRPPRKQGGHIISAKGWLMIFGIGAAMMLGTLLVLDACYPGGLFDFLVRDANDLDGAERYARTLAFTTLVLLQMFNVLNSRSTTRSAFYKLFDNRWLWGAIALSVLCQVAVVYVPTFQTAFQTTSLTLLDWLIAIALASMILWLVEIVKFVGRARGQATHARGDAQRRERVARG